MDKLFTRELLNDDVKLHPKYFGKNYIDQIFLTLKRKYEGKCTKFGYIRTNSITILNAKKGVCDLNTLSGYILVNVDFFAEVCQPIVGSVLNAVVHPNGKNQFGILACISSNGRPVIEIIIPRQSETIISTVDLDNVQPGDTVIVELVSTRFNQGERVIKAVGKIINDTSERDILPNEPVDEEEDIILNDIDFEEEELSESGEDDTIEDEIVSEKSDEEEDMELEDEDDDNDEDDDQSVSYDN